MFQAAGKMMLVLAGLGWLAPTVAAPDMKEGLWDITVRMEMPGMPMAMPPTRHQQCIRKENMVPESPRQPHNQCKMIKREIKGNTLNWVVECETPDGKSSGEGQITYHGDRFEGTLHFRQGSTRMTQHMSGKWLGSCP